jgi:hypothetical protein
MRNQPRKQFPLLIKAFSLLLEQNPAFRKDHYLYLHTSYPEKKCWNIPELITEFNVSNNILMTYKCINCRHTFSSVYGDALKICENCGHLSAKNPIVDDGLSREELAEVYNLFDFYLQISEKEGLGFPMIEAAACGVRFAAPPYSAMVSAIKNLNGVPIRIAALYRDYENSTDICIPDTDSIVAIMEAASMSLDRGAVFQKGVDLVKEHYDWEKCYQNLKRIIDNSPDKDWNKPCPIPVPELTDNSPKNLVDNIYRHILQNNNDRYSNEGLGIQRDVLYGTVKEGEKYVSLNPDRILQLARYKAERVVWCEERRQGFKPLEKEDFLCE